MGFGIRLQVLTMIVYAGPWLTVFAAQGDEGTPAAATSAPATALQHGDDDAGSASDRGESLWRIRPGLLHLNAADGWLGFESEYDSQRVRFSAPRRRDSQQHNQDFRLGQTLGLNLAGDVVDPNLVDWRGSLEMGPLEEWYRERINAFDQRQDTAGMLLRYDFAIDALKSKPVSFHAYARQSDDRVPRQFLPSLHEYVTETGASTLIHAGPLTTEAGFAYRNVVQKGNWAREDNESQETTRFYLDNKLDFTDTHKLRLAFDHERDKSDYQGSSYYDYHTTRNDLRADHELAFGPGNKHRLDTVFQYDNDTGDLARNQMQLSPRLTLQHNDKLQTIYRYSYYRVEQDAIEIADNKFDVEAVYRPNDRWRITLDGFGLYETENPDVRTWDYGGQVDVAYNQPTSLGRLSADLALAYDTSRTSGSAGRRLVYDEAVSLSTVKPAVLRQRNVKLTSILVHDSGRKRIFVAGQDYLATATRGWVLLHRLPFGRIAEGDVVYVDYQYDVPVDATVDTYRIDFMLEHEFKFGLTPYYYLNVRCQQVDTTRGGWAIYPYDQDRHRLGLRFGRERWSVTNEYEFNDDSVEPYQAYHLTGQLNVLRLGAHSLDATGEISHYWFEGTQVSNGPKPPSWIPDFLSRRWFGTETYPRRTWWCEFDLKDRIEINRYLSVNGGAAFRVETDTIYGATHGVDVECGVRYVRGLLTVELTAEYNLLSVGGTRNEGVSVWLNMRRDLGDLLAAAGRGR